ncbi:MAG: heparinase II/III family protein, partial [Clostridiales bacterium]|nr:heparinase II/III family protein [Clostridiales bacterium]
PHMQREIRCVYVFINNWVPWIMSNALLCASVFEKEETRRRAILARCMSYIDRFVDTYGEDGGCNEGASYWDAAVGALFDAAEIIYDMTGGDTDAFGNELFLKMCRFISDMCVDTKKNLFINFADCPAYLRSIDGDMVYRMGRRLGAGDLCALGEALREHKNGENFARYITQFFPYRTVKNLLDGKTAPLSEKENGSFVYENLEVAVMKKGDFIAVLKGGHNRESHNHNDVGNFLLYFKNLPVIIDVGNMEYTKDTFNDNRYKIWNNRSLYHNLPEISGKEQLCGREFRSDAFKFTGDGAFVSYGKAYPECDEISYAKRSVSVSSDSVTLSDDVMTSG